MEKFFFIGLVLFFFFFLGIGFYLFLGKKKSPGFSEKEISDPILMDTEEYPVPALDLFNQVSSLLNELESVSGHEDFIRSSKMEMERMEMFFVSFVNLEREREIRSLLEKIRQEIIRRQQLTM